MIPVGQHHMISCNIVKKRNHRITILLWFSVLKNSSEEDDTQRLLMAARPRALSGQGMLQTVIRIQEISMFTSLAIYLHSYHDFTSSLSPPFALKQMQLEQTFLPECCSVRCRGYILILYLNTWFLANNILKENYTRSTLSILSRSRCCISICIYIYTCTCICICAYIPFEMRASLKGKF